MRPSPSSPSPSAAAAYAPPYPSPHLHIPLTHTLSQLSLLKSKLRNPLLARSTLLDWQYLAPLVLEAAVLAVHVPPFLSGWRAGGASHDRYNVVVFLRLLVLLEFGQTVPGILRHVRKLMGTSQEIGRSQSFALRVLVFQNPITTINVLLGVVAVVFAYIVFVFEREEPPPVMESYHHKATFFAVFYMVYITIATVGYGDLVPTTWQGRLAIVIATFAGLLLTALSVTLIHRELELTRREAQLISYLRDSSLAPQRRRQAATVIQTAWRLYVDAGYRGLNRPPLTARIVHATPSASSITKRLCEQCAALRRTRLEMDATQEPLVVTEMTVFEVARHVNVLLTEVDETADRIIGAIDHVNRCDRLSQTQDRQQIRSRRVGDLQARLHAAKDNMLAFERRTAERMDRCVKWMTD